MTIGIFVVMTVAFGVVGFYQALEGPESGRVTVARPLTQPGVELSEAEKKQLAEHDATQEAARVEYDAAYEVHEDEQAIYSRNALAIVTLIGLVFIIGGSTAALPPMMKIVSLLALLMLGAFSHPALRARPRRALRLGETDELLGG